MGVERQLSPAEAAKLYTNLMASKLRGSTVPFHPADLRPAEERYSAELFEQASQSGQAPHFPTREEAEAQQK